jgi:hypothetical protein
VGDIAVDSFDSPDETRPFEDKGEMRIVMRVFMDEGNEQEIGG